MPPFHAPSVEPALLEQATWMRRLAGALVTGGAADDVAQDAWVSALEHPPAPDRAPRPWLGKVLRNAARMHTRARLRRERREQLADVCSQAPEPDAVVARVQELRLVAKLVGELAEPYRTTVVLHYFEGQSLARIARAAELPAGTVRWRLKQGLDRLRQTLDEGPGRSRASWCALLAPVAIDKPGWGVAFMATTQTVQTSIKLGVVVATLGVVAAVGYTWAGPDQAAAALADDAGMNTPPQVPANVQRTAEPESDDNVAVRSTAPQRFANRAQRLGFLSRLRAARDHRVAAQAIPEPTPGADIDADTQPSVQQREAFQKAVTPEIEQNLIPLLLECAQLHDGPVIGTFGLQVTVAGEPDVGGVIEQVVLVPGLIGPRDTLIDEADVIECIVQSAYALQFPAPPLGGSMAMDMTFAVDTTVQG